MTAPIWITAVATCLSVIVCVILHYEALHLISDFLPTPKRNHRVRVTFLIVCLLIVHIAEIWIFGGLYYGLLQFEGFGQLVNMAPVTLFDCVYYSAVVFTTLGFGDIVPQGPIRFPTGVEAAAGLTFITWSASYTILDMTRTWDDARNNRRDRYD